MEIEKELIDQQFVKQLDLSQLKVIAEEMIDFTRQYDKAFNEVSREFIIKNAKIMEK